MNETMTPYDNNIRGLIRRNTSPTLYYGQPSEPSSNGKTGVENVPLLKSFRKYIIMILVLSMIITFSAQSSMSSALVCIAPADDDNANVTVNPSNTSSTKSEWKFKWDKGTQGWVLSSFFIGYVVSQFPSGLAVTKWGAKRVLVVGLFLIAIFQGLAVPASYYGNKYAMGYLYAERATAGLIDGLLYAPTYALLGKWAPKPEASLLFAFVGSGMEFGNMVSFIIATFSCEINIQGGWPFLFYILSALGFLTTILVAVFMSDSPFNNKFISNKELKYMTGTVPKFDTEKKSLSQVPIKAIFTSVPVWAIVVSQLGTDWFYYLFTTVSPQYLKEVLKFSELQTNLLSGVPFIFSLITIYVSGALSDWLVNKKITSNTNMRKINDFVCKIIPAGAFMGLAFLPEGEIAGAFVLHTIIATTLAFSFVSWIGNPIDLAPAHAGFVVGLCEGACVWVAVVIPVVVDTITVDKTREQWQVAFYITSGLQVVTFVFYFFFASGDLQPWALSTYDKISFDGSDHVDAASSSLKHKRSAFPIFDPKENFDIKSSEMVKNDDTAHEERDRYSNIVSVQNTCHDDVLSDTIEVGDPHERSPLLKK